MTEIIEFNQIKSLLQHIDVITAMKKGFIEYSNGNSVVPPVGELIFDHPPGDVHIKYGYIKNQDFYVVKIASGFYENAQLGIPTGQGLMLVFKQETGQLEAVLLDDGYLTNIRTVAAGALVVDSFSTEDNRSIGIIGTGTIAKMQIQLLHQNHFGATYWLWGRDQAKASQIKEDFGEHINIVVAASCEEIAKNCNILITTTPSTTPLLNRRHIKKGTLIIAIGSDTHTKQELAVDILQKADLIIADSIPQSSSRGEIYQAVKAGAILEEQIIELGKALQDVRLREINPDQITVVDLTGVAVQDIMIASAVYKIFKEKNQC